MAESLVLEAVVDQAQTSDRKNPVSFIDMKINGVPRWSVLTYYPNISTQELGAAATGRELTFAQFKFANS
jgi:hypothetical protein